tara:strand:- start:757 stop:1944 length:1188 start_codon:yes stop_codon:yes gene_type:complete
MPKKDKPKKKYTVSGERTSKEGQTTKVYRKDGSIKSERNIKSSGTKKESRYSASPRTLNRSKKEVEVKDPARASYTKYKKDGTVKKAISAKDAAATNRKGKAIGVDAKVQKKIRKKSVRDKKGAVKVAEKDVKIKRSPAEMKGDPNKRQVRKAKRMIKKSLIEGTSEMGRSIAKKAKKAKKVAKDAGAKASPAKMSGKAYDNKEAYNKNLSASARLHYLENERADDKSPMNMYKKSPMNMYGNKSPLEKELIGKQNNLPPELKAKIEASPAKMYGKKESPMNMSRDLSYGGPVIDQEPKALSHMGASKVLRHMKGSSHSPLNMNGPGKPKEKAMKSDTIRGFDKYNVGDMVSEDDFEAKFKNKGNNAKNYPQLSVQDYSNVKKDNKGKYVVKLND